MIRVVLDTNVVVSAALNATGPPARVLQLAGLGLIQLWISKPVLEEYKEVLYRSRVGVLPKRAKTMLGLLTTIIRQVEPKQSVRVSPDPDDDIFLECSQAAKAHYLVTGNVTDFPARWKYTRIVSPRQFIDEFEDLLTSSQSQSTHSD